MTCRRVIEAASIGLLLLAQPPITAAQYDEVSVVLPKGDVQAGRRAFQDLKCDTCHAVTGEKGLRQPVAELKGPDLGPTLRRQTAGDIAGAIIAPSHSVSVRSSSTVKKRLTEEDRSPMADFSQVMTVRQLADLLAYLTNRR